MYKILVASFVIFSLVTNFVPAKVEAADTIDAFELEGFAWSSNIGWISLNCKNDTNPCVDSSYRVTVNADRTLEGFAWSSNIGWIMFSQSLSGFPTGAGTVAIPAEVTGTYPDLNFVGWARACAGTDAPVNSEVKDCSSMATNDNSGDWDGWISLGGTSYSVTANRNVGMNSNSYAWGSDVVGWIDMFSYVTFSTSTDALATLTGSACTITTADSGSCSGSLSWDIPVSYPSPSVRNVSSSTVGQISTNAAGRNVPVTLVPNATYSFQARSGSDILQSVVLQASCGAGLTVSGTRCIVDAAATGTPTITLNVQPNIVRMGGSATVSWNISDLAGSTCTVSGPGLTPTITTTTGSETTSALKNFTTITIECTGAYGTVEATKTIEVIPLTQEV